MAAAAPGLRPDPSFLREATGACPSYGSPAEPREGRARPGWRTMGAPHPARPGPPGLRPKTASASALRRPWLEETRKRSPTGAQKC